MRVRLSVSSSAPTLQRACDAGPALAGAIEVTPALTVLEGPAPGHVHRLQSSGRRAFVAGRSGEVELVVPDSTVSRRHARLWVESRHGDDRAMIEDLGSTNGTFVNGDRVSRCQLRRGDRVMLGSVVMRFDLLDPVEVKVAEALEETVRRAGLDPLTGLETRRSVGPLDAPALGDVERLSAVLVDLDHFKSINDTFGHPAGDAVLRLAADAIRASLRTGDLAVRWGGEEFLLLLPSAGPEAASAVAGRLLQAIRGQVTDAVTPGRKLTASIGVAAARSGETLGELIARADQALYRAKNTGRDRLISAE